MFVPETVRQAIADNFYDKTVNILDITDILDDEGGLIKNKGEIRDSFQGNVRFSQLGEVMTELGLSESIDICITCRTEVEVMLNDIISYSGKNYQVTSIIPSDSHITIVGKRWQA
ncbi:MAG: hypothetical protein Q4E47_03320 [Candidatus Saccharibacteria bacterium]|nr:hypothetical protein [Candidatus Saccharibacteria bacterium]